MSEITRITGYQNIAVTPPPNVEVTVTFYEGTPVTRRGGSPTTVRKEHKFSLDEAAAEELATELREWLDSIGR